MPYLKMLWETESPTPQSDSWDYWTSVKGVAFSIGNSDAVKNYNKIAYYAVFKKATNDYRVLFISPDYDAAEFEFEDYVNMGSSIPVYDVNNIGWYWAVSDPIKSGRSRISQFEYLLIDDNIYSTTTQAVNALLNKIYAVPFHEDYQPSGYNYITVPAGDIRKTVRKALGLHLAFNDQYYSTNSNYQALSDGVDGMIDDIVNNDRSANGNINIQINPRYTTSYATQTLVRYMTDNRSLTARINAKETYNNLPYYQTTYNTSMNYYEREYRNATYRYYGSSAISGGLIGVRCFDRGGTLSANNAGIDL